MRRIATSLLVLATALFGCNEDELVTGVDTPTPAPEWSDVYQQGTSSKVDILWVVDNSGSMGDEQTELANHFDQFINAFVQMNLDFQIAIITTDMQDASESGRFQGSPLVLTPDTPNLVQTFKSNVQVGIGGSGQEMGLEAARTALSEPLLSNENAGFLRSDAHLAIIVVSDEDDGGSETNPPVQPPVDDFMRHFDTLKNGNYSFSALVGDMPAGCANQTSNADAGVRYHQAAGMVDGLISSICAENFAPVLAAMGEYIGSLVSAHFEMTYEPVEGSVLVYVDGQEIPSGDTTWGLDMTTHAVVFVVGAEPQECSEVLIAYARAGTDVLSGTPGGTGYDPICPESTPFDPPDPITNGNLNGGAIAQCAFITRPETGAPSLGAALCLLGVVIVVTRRRRRK